MWMPNDESRNMVRKVPSQSSSRPAIRCPAYIPTPVPSMLMTNAVIMPTGPPSHQPTGPRREAPRNGRSFAMVYRGRGGPALPSRSSRFANRQPRTTMADEPTASTPEQSPAYWAAETVATRGRKKATPATTAPSIMRSRPLVALVSYHTNSSASVAGRRMPYQRLGGTRRHASGRPTTIDSKPIPTKAVSPVMRVAPCDTPDGLTSWLGDGVLGIVPRIDVRHREGAHRAHSNDGRPLRRGEVVRVRRQRALIARLHRLRLRGVERVAHADEERALPDFDGLIGGMEMRRDFVTARHGQLDRKGGSLAGVAAHDRHLRACGKDRRGRAPL